MLPLDDEGTGEAVVLTRAGVADRTMWREHLGWLADAGFRAIAVDLPGFGEAPVEPGPQAPWNSFGAAVAMRVAAMQRRAFELRAAARARPVPIRSSGPRGLLRRLRGPVLAAAGEADMVDFKLAAEEVVQLVADGRLETIARAGHLAPPDDSGRCCSGSSATWRRAAHASPSGSRQPGSAGRSSAACGPHEPFA
jgi:pimeloyl-ACP methyl ester carboxylesterase